MSALDDSTLGETAGTNDNIEDPNLSTDGSILVDQLFEGSLIQRQGAIGYLKDGRFQMRSNFCAEVSGLVKSGDGHIVGYLFQITRIDEGLPRNAFLSNTDCASSVQILKCLNKCFSNKGLWIPKDPKLDPALPLLFQSLIKNYVTSEQSPKEYKPVVVIGRQPHSDTWVINESMQIDSKGALIPIEDRVFIYETSLVERISPPINMSATDSGEALRELLLAMEDLLGDNFFSSLCMVAGMAMSVHAELIYKQRHAMPMVMAVGEPKSGKSTALECATSLVGIGIFATGSGFSFASAMEQANGSTMGYAIDDIKDDKLLQDIVIATYNKGGYVNMYAGRKTPKSTPLLTSNWTCEKERISSRLAMVPFQVPKKPLKGIERMLKEKRLTSAQADASKSLGLVISLGETYEEAIEYIYGDLAEYVLGVIGESMTREAINYAEMIFFLVEICRKVKLLSDEQEFALPEEWPTEETVKEEFKKLMGSLMNLNETSSHRSSEQISKVKAAVLSVTDKKCPLEVLTYILPKVTCKIDKKDTACVAINIPLLLTYHKDVFGEVTAEQLRDEIKNDQNVVGIFQNHFLQPGWFPGDSELTTPVKIKRSGSDKNSKSLLCMYLKRSCFGVDEVKVLESVLNRHPKKRNVAAVLDEAEK